MGCVDIVEAGYAMANSNLPGLTQCDALINETERTVLVGWR